MDDFNKAFNALIYDTERAVLLGIVIVVMVGFMLGLAILLGVIAFLKRRLERSRVTSGAPEGSDLQPQ